MIKIDPEFRALISPLTAEERADLANNILRDGCREPLALWGDILIDGHNRFEICTKDGLAFNTIQIEGLEDRDDVKIWIITNQFGRRNLAAFQRVELALQLKPLEEAKAKARQLRKPADSVSQNSDEQTRTDDSLAEMAGVSRDTVRKVETILQTATP